MTKTLVVVESPSKQEKIQEILGSNYSVLATFGHIADLPPNKMGIDVNNNFKPTYVLMRDKISVLQSILDEAGKCDDIIICSDPDREGERIAWDINRYLTNLNKPISRALLMEITKKGIKDGIINKKEIDQNLVSSQSHRRIIDRLVGFSCSPYLTNHYGSNLSAGRVQSSVVKLIVDLEKKIEDFKSEEFWNISAEFCTKDKEIFHSKYEGKIKNKEDAELVLNEIKNEEGFNVSSVIAKDKPKAPNPPLITVKLQQIMAKEYGFDAERSMKSMQSLYENGLITYLRTDSVRISEEALISSREYLKSKGFSIPKKPNSYEDKGNAQAGHECIRPTNLDTTPEAKILLGDDALVYKTIYECFLASQMLPSIYSTLQIKIVGIKNKNLMFKTSGKAIKELGFLAIFGNKSVEKLDLPLLMDNELVNINSDKIKSEQKFTQPPSRYNDASILEELEVKGIGRPATYANIIKTITGRNYVEKNAQSFVPTKLGRDITELLEKSFSFVNHNYTRKMELRLDQIAEGKLKSLDVLNEFYSSFKKELEFAYTMDGSDICICGDGVMLRRKSKSGSDFFGCSKYPNCRVTKSIDDSDK